ncbi:MAG: alcohol dehydrogenase catalytic domain-containing protein, partial [Armatimonadetes bacterium]|nr:alcohol dehydrogenase catalytic domain-containing protein [Armatimonadota bacterium]
MTDVVKQYRSVEIPVPARNRSWFLYGAGMENLGRDRKPVEHDMEIPGPDELLVRCDATCLCFSDVKIINQGGDHLRIRRDLSREPTVMGHESAVTVVRVGTDVQDRFKVGERYVVQADVYINGQTRAYGYALPGALRQYNILNWEVLNGDDGCYLIPVDESTGYAEAALSEPWACVVHSYRLEYRQMVKPGGVCLMVGGVGAEKLIVGNTFQAGVPGRIVAANLPEGLMRSVRETGCGVTELRLGEIDDTDALVERFTDGSGFDDIIVCGKSDPDRLEALAGKLSRGGVFNIVCGEPVGRPLSIDVGRVHYEEWYYTGNPGPDIGASYASHRSPTELKPGGTTWMMGAGGPMGQMHVQRACEMPAGPSTIVATDIDANRLQELQDRFTPASEASGRRLILLNPNELAADEPGLFTDISRLPHPSTGSGCGLLDGAGFQIRPHQG